MGHTITKRTIAAAIAGTALLLTSAGACESASEDGGTAPGVSTQQGDDAGDDDGADDDGAGDDG